MSNALKAKKRPFEVVVVEDSRGDAGMIVTVLRQDERDLNLTILTDGAKAVAHLTADMDLDEGLVQPRPDLILLDLELPHRSGFEVLMELRSSKRWRDVPVVVFTSSQRPGDAERVYELGANALVQKPLDFDSFVATVRAIEHFWLDVVAAPEFRPRTS